jgi:hypothetical protein
MNTVPRQLDFGLHILLIFILLSITMVNQAVGLYFALVAQFFVGIYQVLSSIGRTLKYYGFDRSIQKMILLYWGFVVLYGIGWIIVHAINADIDITIPYLYGAWSIAFYYCYITYRLAFPKYIKSHLDI